MRISLSHAARNGAAPKAAASAPASRRALSLRALSLAGLCLAALGAPARAAPVALTAGGLGDAHAVQALVRSEAGLVVSDCNDAGQAPDAAVDGRWQCQAVDVEGDEAVIALLVDARLVKAGTARWSGGGDRAVWLLRQAGGVTLSPRDDLTQAVAGATARGPGSTLIARIQGYTDPSNPVLRLGGAGAEVQLNCRDDGTFPDPQANDGELTCIGLFDGDQATVGLAGAGGQLRSVGTVALGPGPVRSLTVDLAQGTLDPAPFENLGIFVPLLRAVETAPVLPASTTYEHPADPAPTGSQPPGLAPPSGTIPLAPQLPSVPPWLLGLAGVGLALAVGVGLGLRPRARRGELASLRRLPSPALVPGGPSLTERGCLLRAEDPLALALALVERLARERRVVVAAPPGLALPEVGGASVFAATDLDWRELARGVRALAATPGPEVALLVVGAHVVQDPGAVGDDPMGALERALPPGTWLGHLVPRQAVLASWLPAWVVQGPPWTMVREG